MYLEQPAQASASNELGTLSKAGALPQDIDASTHRPKIRTVPSSDR